MGHCFGEIQDGKMVLNKYGLIAKRQIDWLEIQYPYLIIDNYIVMPNHVHILCEINRVGAGRDQPLRDQPLRDHPVQTGRDLSVLIKIKSISELMGAFKTTSSKHIHLLGCAEFAWQRSFYDHIVRSNEAYCRIDTYITNNPMNWKSDKFGG